MGLLGSAGGNRWFSPSNRHFGLDCQDIAPSFRAPCSELNSVFPWPISTATQATNHWLKLLREDDRAILTAAARAEEASSLLLKLGGRETVVAEEPGDDALAA